MIKNGYPRLFAVNVTISVSLQPLPVPPSHRATTATPWGHSPLVATSQTVRTAADRHAPRLTPQRKSRRAGRRNTPANTLNAPPKRSRPRSRSSARKRFAIIAETVGGERFANHHHVGDVRGRGLVQAIGLVLDRASKATFDPKHQLARGYGTRSDGLSDAGLRRAALA